LADAVSAQAISLDQFVHDATARNLSLKAIGASTEAKQQDAYGIRLPPPQASLIQMHMSGSDASGFMVDQSVPFPTKITSEHNTRRTQALANEAAKNAREREITSAAKFLYFRLWESQERFRLLNEKAKIVKDHIRLARAAARSDSFLKIHVLKAENDLDLLKNEILQAEQGIRERQIEAAEFLNRDPQTFRPVALEFPLSPIPNESSLEKPFQLQTTKFELESLRSKEKEVRASWFPDFNLQYKEMGATPMMPRYSEVMVGATFPFVFFWETKAESDRAAAERQEGEFLFEKERLKIDAERTTLLERAASLKKQLDQFSNELIPRAEKRLKIVHNLAPRDMETMQDQRETMEAFPDLKLKALSVREQYEKTVMELEKFKSGEAR
jgi:outer membrane protein TolC